MAYAYPASFGKKATLFLMALMGAVFIPKANAQTVLFVSSTVPTNQGDSAAIKQIASMGYAVVAKSATASQPADTAGKAMVVISSTCTSGDVNTKFRNVLIPVLTWESALLDDMAMVGTGSGQFGVVDGQTQVQIVLAGHRLAAGLSGTQTVFTSGDQLTWGVVPATATKVATVAGDASRSVVFGYEAGTAMVGLNAPARRVGFFTTDNGPSKWTAQGSSLFRAAFLWAANASDPRIITNPLPVTVNAGQAATFNVSANGAGIMTYQWRKNGINIPGATSAGYTTPPAVAADNGASFSCAVTGANATSNSASALLTVLSAAPVITAEPIPDSAIVGQTAFFSVTATGAAPLTYQWRKNGAAIPGAVGSSYTTPAVVVADNNALFSVIVTNAGGSDTSANAKLTVIIPAPVIVSHPASMSVPVGNSGTFSVVATGTPPLTYQWRKNGTDIPGANLSSYTTPPATMADSGAGFSVAVTNPGGTVFSNVAILTVFPNLTAPVITTQPTSITVSVGDSAYLSVVATGSAPLVYEWFKDSSLVGTSQTLVISDVTPAHAGNYQVRVSNGAGFVLSNIVSIIVVPVVPPGASTRDWMTITGELFDAAGNPVGPAPGAPVATDMEVRLYTNLSGGIAVYSETFFAADTESVPVADGYFAAHLGQGTTTGNLASVIADNRSLYAEILIGTTGSQDVLSPRTPLTASPFAIAPTAAKRGVGDPNGGSVQGSMGAYYIDNASNATWIKTNTVWVKLSP